MLNRKLIVISFIILMLSSINLFAGDFEAGIGVCSYPDARGQFNDDYDLNTGTKSILNCGQLRLKYVFDFGLSLSRESIAVVKSLLTKTVYLTNANGDYYPDRFTYGAGSSMVGWSFGDNPRFSIDYGFPEKSMVTLTLKKKGFFSYTNEAIELIELIDKPFTTQIFGVSANIGGAEHGLVISLRYLDMKTDNLLGTGKGIDLSGLYPIIIYRYRWE
ncbi:MAG: hypothetical protein OEY59_02270 [Deltaproteobacteria bacterium]|nr:hypothetical protein [Deltaproteobacteria bacterium]